MTIQRNSRIAGVAITAVMGLAAVVAATKIDQIRFGGPIQRSNQQVSDLVADILPPPEYVIEPYLEATLLVHDAGSIAQRKPRLAALRRQFEDRHRHWRASDLDPALKGRIIDQSGAAAQRFWTELETALLPAVERDDRPAVQASYARLTRIYSDHRQKIDALVAATTDHQAKLGVESKSALDAALAWLVGAGVLVACLLIAGLVYLGRSVLHPLAETADGLDRLARGDMTATVSGAGRRDEIGKIADAFDAFRAATEAKAENEAEQQKVVDELGTALGALSHGDLTYRIRAPLAPQYERLRSAFNESVDQFCDLLGRVAGAASSVQGGSAEIRAASDDLALRTEQQAANLEETAAAMTQVTAMVKQTADRTHDVNDAIGQAHREATDGGAVVRRAVEAMEGIERSASEITQIIEVIDGIAFQTNLLALNAGVEAARAGDSGRGFAVVANEVRALALRSADAARHIKDLITASAGQVSNGVAMVGETGVLLDRIVHRVSEASALTDAIAQSAKVQANSVQLVNGTIGEMDKATQQNAAMVEESTAAARSLADEAQTLSSLIARFTLAPESDTGTVSALPTPPAAHRRGSPMVSGNLALHYR